MTGCGEDSQCSHCAGPQVLRMRLGVESPGAPAVSVLPKLRPAAEGQQGSQLQSDLWPTS